MKKIGILAIQGDFEKHGLSLQSCGVPERDIQFVRTVEHLATIERLIIPGGESTTVGMLLERYGLGAAITERALKKMPIWGTCMGMILMAREIEKYQQFSLNLLDIKVRRNAFGAQVNSFEDEVEIQNCSGISGNVLGVFIRAPIVLEVGDGVNIIAQYEKKIVGVQQDLFLGTSFHPELTNDTKLHEYFLGL